MMVIDNLPEVRVLFKALYGLKYGADSDLLDEVIGSPIFADLFNRVAKEYSARYSDLQYMPGKVIYEQEWNIENRDEINRIIEYLMDYEYWGEIGEAKKLTVVRTFISPFYASDEYLINLVKKINKDWKPKN
ncbi:hypothetical protein SAMN05660909_05689 [Chitinophaga terrae (ex Kim and Jung 2007)]|uniref:Uncharacterized protein n=1 Tax=Chitinophaga terrae (ex Kim and Jung 2007) TaxID=408074 RepID=A0A1H4GT78_9BACT|nr:hypothetical protein [Chitinophaga terrae (ex Kim and Jung 2007)]GEP93724.1 hypothetical protein CTE07_53690 [Chitinophaga terrae (ex Kim and Jung 2007)]SEB12747.1 hypothetical protein SAMN05660909_05689 [Chitinophaga terrae (ex Kim and Jung 2007)]